MSKLEIQYRKKNNGEEIRFGYDCIGYIETIEASDSRCCIFWMSLKETQWKNLTKMPVNDIEKFLNKLCTKLQKTKNHIVVDKDNGLIGWFSGNDNLKDSSEKNYHIREIKSLHMKASETKMTISGIMYG